MGLLAQLGDGASARKPALGSQFTWLRIEFVEAFIVDDGGAYQLICVLEALRVCYLRDFWQ